MAGGATGEERLAYIGKEKDQESNLGDHGVRKYDYETGHFTSTDVLWEKYAGWSPYHYCGNNPISRVDWNGKEVIVPIKGDRKKVEKMINDLALGSYKIDANGKLTIINEKGKKGSKYYQDKLIGAINRIDKIEISIKSLAWDPNEQNYIDVLNQCGGGVAFSEGKLDQNQNITNKTSYINLSGTRSLAIEMKDGSSVFFSPAEILLHEILGHSIPFICGPDTGNAVDNENKARQENGLQLRKTDPEHKE